MTTLLKIKISGYKMLSDNFELNFVPYSKVTENDIGREIVEVDKNLYTYSVCSVTGSNSSGKTTVISMLTMCLFLMKSGRWRYNPLDFKNDTIKLCLELYIDGKIYICEMDIKKPEVGSNRNEFCIISNEVIQSAKYRSSVGRKYREKLSFNATIKPTEIPDTSSLYFLCKDGISLNSIIPLSNNGYVVDDRFFNSLNSFNDELTTSIIRLLDNSIEYIVYDGSQIIRFKRFGENEITLNKIGLLSLLSNGTIRGIELYIDVVKTLKAGGVLVIDEIEDCFHKNLVNNILLLFMDSEINKKRARIFFSTHYVEILDILNRRDNIFVTSKMSNGIILKNVSKDYKIRTEILKSRQFNNNTFNTLLNYESLMKVKRLVKDEILNNG